MPFHTQSMFLALSSPSLADQSIGWNLTLTPIFLVTALARSISNPTSLSSLSLNPIGANVSSRPTTRVPLSLTYSRSDLEFLPHPASPIAVIIVNTRAAHLIMFFFIILLFIVSLHYISDFK